LGSGEPFEGEARVQRADGEYRWMLHRKIPLRDEHGKIVKWDGSSINIDNRKRVEGALHESHFLQTELMTHWELTSTIVKPKESLSVASVERLSVL
jgi:hypothetical protein